MKLGDALGIVINLAKQNIIPVRKDPVIQKIHNLQKEAIVNVTKLLEVIENGNDNHNQNTDH